jgi:Delta3-Delta2-enoyl-CoA isomerase
MLEIIDHPPSDPTSGAAGVRELRLARPRVNALDGPLLARLAEAVAEASDAGAIVITGQPGMFSAGLDVPALLKLDHAGIASVFAQLWRAQRAIATAPVPIVFGITGHCPAGGTVLAIHADYRVMAQGDYRLGLNEVQVGLFPGDVIHGAFCRLVGGHAAQLLTRGALLDPATALRVGLVDELCPAESCVPRALEVAAEWCALPREPMMRTRELVRRDLVQLFGEPGDAGRRAASFGEWGAQMWFAPQTLRRLEQLFARRAS